MNPCKKYLIVGTGWFCLALLFAAAGVAQNNNPGCPPASAREDGVVLFNGKDFSGWTFYMKNNADPMPTWSVTNGVIHCTGTPVGYLRTKQSYSNYVLNVEWRFVKIAPGADNAGVMVHIQSTDKIWPRCVQSDGLHNKQGDLYLMEGAGCREHQGMDKNRPVPMRGPSNENPAGEWNTCEMVCDGSTISTSINGRLMNEITGCNVSSGKVGIQCEGGELEIRKIFLKPLPHP